MNQPIKNKTFIDILNDTTHRSKARDVFLKHLAKQKRPANPFDKVKSHIYAPKESLAGVNQDDLI